MITVDSKKVHKAIKGDLASFTGLIDERKGDLYRIAYIYARDGDAASDILQDIVFKSFKSVRKLRNPDFFNTWLTRIAINCSMSFLKKSKKISKNEIQCIDSDDGFDLPYYDDITELISDRIDLADALGKLDFKLKTTVILKYYQNLTITQIAEILSCPTGTVKTRLKKSLNLLRSNLSNYFEEELL